MTETRLGRQTPTQSVTIPYSKTRGQEAAELYAKTGNELLEWQQLLQKEKNTDIKRYLT